MNRPFDELLSDSSFKTHIEKLFNQKIIDYNTTHILEIELTNRCSVGCFYCGENTETSSMDLDFDLVCSAMDHFSKSRVRHSIRPHFSFTGGDPLEYIHMERLLHVLKEKSLSFSLKLNPSTVTKDMVEMIASSNCESVKMTFMGRHSQGKYRKKDTLHVLSEATERFCLSGIPVVWHFSLGEFNRNDLLESLPFVVENRPAAVSIGRLARVGRLNDRNYPRDIRPDDFRDFLRTMLLFYYNHKRYGFNLIFKEKLWLPFLCELGLLSLDDLRKKGAHLGCDAMERLLVMTYSGDLLGCGLIPKTILSQYGKPDFNQKLQTIYPPLPLSSLDPCGPCDYLTLCRGCRGVMAGASDGIDPQCWVMDKHAITDRP